MNTVYKKIKELRERANYTQRYVADELGVDSATYSRIERGKIDMTISRLVEIASVLHVAPEELFADNAKKVDFTQDDNTMEITLNIKVSKEKSQQIMNVLFDPILK